jgi:hypothetical protein
MSKIKIEVYNEELDDYEDKEVNAQWIICRKCQGEGKIVNPAIDGNGLSAEDFAQNPDFKEDYMNGVYDIPCPECSGSGKILEPDPIGEEQEKLVELWLENRREVAEMRQQEEQERKYGA